MTLPSTYLGLLLGSKQKSARVWEGIEENFRIRLVVRKRQYISKGGRLTLIRSTLFNLPIYLLSLFRPPKSVKCRLEKNPKRLPLWGGSLANKIHLLNWRTINLGKEKGGLGIIRLDLEVCSGGKLNLEVCSGGKLNLEVLISAKYGSGEGEWFTPLP